MADRVEIMDRVEIIMSGVRCVLHVRAPGRDTSLQMSLDLRNPCFSEEEAYNLIDALMQVISAARDHMNNAA